jgi:hypothetical protein
MTEELPVVEPAAPPLASEPAVAQQHIAILKADRTTWFVTVTAAIVLTASRYHASTGEYQELAGKFAKRGGLYAVAAQTLHLPRTAQWLAVATGPIADYIYWFLSSLILFAALPLIAAAIIPGIRLREFGLGAGDWRYGLKAFAFLYLVMLPFVVGASYTATFAGQYPMCGGATSGWHALVIYECCYAAYFIGWEFVYRGLLCNGLYPRIGAAVILLQTIPFAVMHAGKPEAESFGAIIAGIALGTIAVRARSFWYGVGLHAAVAMTMDALAMTHAHKWPKSW